MSRVSVTGRRLAAMSAASAPPAERVFAEFCAAGLWPGLGRTTAGRLAPAGITGPELVTAGRLEMVEGVGPKRAERLAGSFEEALPAYDVAEILVPCRVPAKFAGAAVGYLGKSAAVRLRQDPWLLLSLPQIQPDQADWFARQLLGDQAGGRFAEAGSAPPIGADSTGSASAALPGRANMVTASRPCNRPLR